MVCRYCNGVIEGGESSEHAACSKEWNRRYDAGVCTRCGEGKAESFSPACSTCIYTKRTMPYRGYPGGAAK